MKHSSEECFCESMDKSLASQVVVNLDTHLYSLSFHFDEIALHSSLYDQSLDSCSISESSYRCRCYLRNELLFHPCSTAGHGISSDISLHVMSDATSLLDLDIQALKEAVIKLSMRPADVYRTCQSAGCANSLVNLIQDQGTHSWNHLPQGDLVSLEGTVVSLHSGCCAVDKLTCHASAHDVHQLRFAQGWKNLICLRVLTHCDMVEISGCLYKHNYPIGLGPGADVTFHRVLASSEQGHLLLMPVSFITVNSVKEVVSPVANSFSSVGKGNVPSLLISDLIHCDECKPIRFCCRIVAVQIVMLERNSNLDKLLSDIHPRKVITNIPLAGFILDDGSSQCCCWANGERAVTFLRLHEELPPVGFGSCWWRLPGVGADKACSTPSSYLDKILKRHGRVTVKNYASVYETSCQDLQLSASSEFMFGTQDQNILRFIVLNACYSTYWSVIGHVMDSNAINELGKYLMEEQMNMPALPNLWAREVCPVDILTEARSLYQDL